MAQSPRQIKAQSHCKSCDSHKLGFPYGSAVKNPPAMQGPQEMQVLSLGWEDPLKEDMAAHSFLPGESHGHRSLAGYSPWGRKESHTAAVTQHSHTHSHKLSGVADGSRHTKALLQPEHFKDVEGLSG